MRGLYQDMEVKADCLRVGQIETDGVRSCKEAFEYSKWAYFGEASVSNRHRPLLKAPFNDHEGGICRHWL